MGKKIAVLVKDNPAEGMRMAVGLTLADDEVNVYVLDTTIDESDEGLALNVETLGDLDVKIFTNTKANAKFELMDAEQIARSLPNYDAVIPY